MKSRTALFAAIFGLGALMGQLNAGIFSFGKSEKVEGKVFCNPLNIDYQPYEKKARTAADPVIVPFENKYYLFCSLYKGGKLGYRISDDLVNWKLVEFPARILEKILNKNGEGYAPAVFAYDGYVYWNRLDSPVVIRSKNPSDPESWEVYSEKAKMGFDPCYFLDDDGKIYDYSGALESNVAQLNPKDFTSIGGSEHQLTPKTKGAESLINSPYGLHQGQAEYENWNCDWNEPETLDTKYLIRRDPPLKRYKYDSNRGAKVEVPPQKQFSTRSTFSMQEAAWMTKYNGKYYLQNSNPGTACPWYSDSVYVSDSPNKDFKLADYATASMKVGGFINSTGHSCVFQDFNGNWWRITTMWVGVLAGFERRLGLFPVGFDKEGRMYTQTYLGDYPMIIPNKKVPMGTSLLKGWTLKTPERRVACSTASSSLDKFKEELVHDENVRTWWSAKTGDAGEWISMRCYGEKVNAIQISFAEQDIDQSAVEDDFHSYKIYYQDSEVNSDAPWKLLIDKSDNKTSVPHDFIELKKPVEIYRIKIENVHMAKKGKFAIREIRLFGEPSNSYTPKALSNVKAIRDKNDPRNIKFSWEYSHDLKGQPYHDGYIINYGVAPDALHLNVQYQAAFKNDLTLSCFNKDAKDYWFRIDTYNSNGITKGKVKKVEMGDIDK